MNLFIIGLVTPVIGQSTQQEYLNSKQKKGSFDDGKYSGLKKQMIKESSPSKSSNGKNTDNSIFSKEYTNEGDYYNYEKEEYKGEYEDYNYENNEEYEDQKYYQPEYDAYDKENVDADENTYDDNSDGYDYFEKEYNQKEYKDYQDKKEYESEKGSSKSSNSKNQSSQKNEKKKNPTSGEIQGMQVLLILLGAAVIAFIVYYFFLRYNVDETGKKIEIEEELPPMEIPKSELERRLELALSNENYREAVRIYFIFIIKDLNDKNWIKWEKDKTNMSYLFEMRKRPQYELFNQSVTLFEWVWYGNYTITKAQYNQWEKIFKELLAEINKK